MTRLLAAGLALALAAPPELADTPAPAPIVPQPIDAWPEPVVAEPEVIDPPPEPPQPMLDRRDLPPRVSVSPQERPRRGLGLVISGFSMAGVAYLQQVITMGLGGGSGALFVPLAGPFLLSGVGFTLGPSGVGVGVGFAVLGAAEFAGLVMGITGAAKLGRARARGKKARLWYSGGGLRLEF